jgi:hypothetical protein
MLDEILESIVEGFHYLISFSWLGDLGELFGSMFENMSELSMYGLAMGIVGAGTVFLAKDYMLTSFTKYMSPIEGMFWTGATYIGTFVAGYFMGKHFENTA